MKKLIIGIGIGILLVALCIGGWVFTHPKFDKSNPVIFEQQTNDDYAYIMYQGREYVPYSAISSSEREKYLGYVGNDKQNEIYTFKGHSEEEWIINYLDSGLMNDCMLLKEKNVTNIPEGLSSEYKWNINVSNQNTTTSYIPDGVNVDNENDTGIPVDTLKFNRNKENVTIEVLQNTITKEKVEILITDNNEDQYGWGVQFKVQEEVNGEWKDLNYISDDLSWIDIAYELNKDNQLTQKLDIAKYYGELKSGIYRIVKPVYDNGYIDIYSNEFEIK